MIYDAIVIGGGHAGIEASLALAKMNQTTLLITGNLNKVASLPCNPSIGGPAKGIVVREIDALGGQMAKSADLGQIQMKLLNASKGPAVRALRAQIDRIKYPQIMLSIIKEQANLYLLEGLVSQLIIGDKEVRGVILEDGQTINARVVIITTGTYLSSNILIGHDKISSGPDGDKTTSGLSNQLKELGFELIRLKTGTPPRIDKTTIDYTKTSIQPGDENFQTFSYESPIKELGEQLPCYLTHTNLNTHQIIEQNLGESSMYGGLIEGVGPRYCPSIEDKIVRFNDKERHQVFLEPESLESNEIYVQGISTSMPKNIQEQIIHSIAGLENAKILKYAYAIEYDAINPHQLYRTLETKKIQNLYCAGQINGTSGYEEAAGQGLMAGINAGLKLAGKEPLILGRNEAYIGVLIDDLITKGTTEPYRLLTSRAEHRLLLRHDNADLRLKDYGYQVGLIDQNEYQNFQTKKQAIKELSNLAQTTRINPTNDNLLYLNKMNSALIYEGIYLADLLKRPELGVETLKHFTNNKYQTEVYEAVNIQIKYQGYIDKANREVERVSRLEEKRIPNQLDYDLIHNLSNEAKEKLKKVKPETVGQASRILGVNPADISILMVFLEVRNV